MLEFLSEIIVRKGIPLRTFIFYANDSRLTIKTNSVNYKA